MNQRILIIGVSIVFCVVTLANVFVRQRELSSLRADQQRQLARIAASAEDQSAQTTAITGSEDSPASSSGLSPTLSELLQLRSQAGQLMKQQRELAGARTENEQLHAQLATRGTNDPVGVALLPGYIRRSQAQWVGASTPESTLQSFLWAVQNRDTTNFLRLLVPQSSERLLQMHGNSPERIFDDVSAIPGMRIVSQQQLDARTVGATVEMIPGQPSSKETIFFMQDGGEWKMALP